MLGDTAAAVKATLKTLVDPAALGADEAARELSLMQIAAVWHACHALQTQFATRRAKMEEDPSKVPEMAQEDHAEFRGRFVRNHPDVVLLGCEGAAQEVRREAQQGFSWCTGWSLSTQPRKSEPGQTLYLRKRGSPELQKISLPFLRQTNLIRSLLKWAGWFATMLAWLILIM